MSSSGLECNIEETFNAFMNLTTDEMNKAVRRALRAGAKELQLQTKQNLTASLNKRNNEHWYDGKIQVYSDTVEDAVRLSRMDGDVGEELSQKVHIMGSRAKTSGTFRTRFLEKGTKERYATKARNKNHELITLKKPKYLGRITGKWFFKNAQNQVFPNLPSLYLKEIDKTIEKINKTTF